MSALDLDLLVDIDEIADLEAPAETQRQVTGGDDHGNQTVQCL